MSSYVYNNNLLEQGTTTNLKNYQFIDTSVEPGKNYTCLLADMSYQLEEPRYLDNEQSIYMPLGMKVGDAYPNPFNPQCSISFTIDAYQHITAHLLDISGKKIKELVNRQYSPGSYHIIINDPSLSSGIYLVHIGSGNKHEVKKILMSK